MIPYSMSFAYWQAVGRGEEHPHADMWAEYEKKRVVPVRLDRKNCHYARSCKLFECIINAEFDREKAMRAKPFTRDKRTGLYIDEDGKIVGYSGWLNKPSAKVAASKEEKQEDSAKVAG